MTNKDFIIFLFIFNILIGSIGIAIGIIVAEIKNYLDDNILHKDFNVEKWIEENSYRVPLEEDRYLIKLDVGNLKRWQAKRIVDYVEKTGFSFIRNKSTNESSFK